MIRILRLTSGEDIIGNASEQYVGQYKVSEPMSVGIDFRGREAGLVMNHWLPVQLIKENEITIEPKDILCVMEPNDELREYYLNTVQKIKDLLSAKNIVDEFNTDEIIEAFQDMINHGDTLH